MACIDGLSGFAEAIHAAYPQASVQLCIVHLVRAALRYVNSEDSKEVVRDLKKIYQAATVIEGLVRGFVSVGDWHAISLGLLACDLRT